MYIKNSSGPRKDPCGLHSLRSDMKVYSLVFWYIVYGRSDRFSINLELFPSPQNVAQVYTIKFRGWRYRTLLANPKIRSNYSKFYQRFAGVFHV